MPCAAKRGLQMVSAGLLHLQLLNCRRLHAVPLLVATSQLLAGLQHVQLLSCRPLDRGSLLVATSQLRGHLHC